MGSGKIRRKRRIQGMRHGGIIVEQKEWQKIKIDLRRDRWKERAAFGSVQQDRNRSS